MKSLLILAVGMLFTCSLSHQDKEGIMSNPYNKEWVEIDDLDRKGLPKSALEKVEDLISKLKSGEEDQRIKCIIYRNKYLIQLEEYGPENAIARMEDEAENSTGVTKAILHSMLGELYYWYGERYQHKLSKRTTVNRSEDPDLATWSLQQIIAKSNDHYNASISGDFKNKELLGLEAILNTYTPTTIDFIPDVSTFLRYRALEHFSKKTSMLTEPVYAFHLNQEVAFADRSDFLAATFDARDTNSYVLRTIQLYQEILRVDNQNKGATHYFDNARLQFVHQHSTHQDKDTLFEQALSRLVGDQNPYAVVTLAKFYIGKGKRYQENFDSKYNWQMGEAHELLSDHKFSKSDTILYDEHLRLLGQIEQKTLSFQVENVVIPNRPFLTYIRYQNMDQLYCKVVKVDRDFISELNFLSQQEMTQRLLDRPIYKQWNVELEGDDYNLHATEIRCEGLPLGQYVLLVSDTNSEDSSSLLQYSSFQVSNLSASVITGGDPVLVGVTDRWTGSPLEDVEITYFHNRYDHRTRKQAQDVIATGTTNSDGIHELQIGEQRNISFQFIKGEDYFYPNYHVSNHRYTNNNTRRDIHIFTDRNLYRPGQTIHFKGLVLDINSHGVPAISANESVTVTLKDANYQDVKKLKLQTNDYGSVNGHFTAPDGGLNGAMSIIAKVTNGNGRQSIRVEEYKRPKFEVEIDKPTTAFALQDTVSITGSAKMFSSAPVDGAQVKYNVTRKSRYYGWYYRGQGNPSMQITSGITETQADGSFSIRFPLIPDNTMDKAGKPVFSYEVQAEVIDRTGETHTANYTVRAGYDPILIDIVSKEVWDKASNDSLIVNTTNYSGGDVATNGKLHLYKLQEPNQPFVKKYWGKVDKYAMDKAAYKSEFPFYKYDSSDEKENWTIVDSITTNVVSKERINLPDLKVGTYKLVAAFDYQGQTLNKVKYLDVIDSDRKLMGKANTVIDGIIDPMYQPGDVVRWQPISHDSNHQYYYAVQKGGRIVEKGWKDINSPLKVPVTNEDRGGFFIHTFYNKQSRIHFKTTQIKVPWHNKDLEISYERWKDKLTPGEEVEWIVSISGDKQDRVEAEYLTAMYDASLDAIGHKHAWKKVIYPTSYSRLRVMAMGYDAAYSIPLQSQSRINEPPKSLILPQLNWYQLNEYIGYYPSYQRGRIMQRGGEINIRGAVSARKSMALSVDMASGPPGTQEPMMEETVQYAAANSNSNEDGSNEVAAAKAEEKKQPPSIRENLDETVFFYPNIETDADGKLKVKFKMNEALTEWKVISMAHTKDLAYGFDEQVLQTYKDLMVYPNMPRFLRIGDNIILNVKVINSSEKQISGNADMQLKSLDKGENINAQFQVKAVDTNFILSPGESKEITWSVQVPTNYLGLVEYEVSASSGTFTDGERGILPVITNRKLVTETMPIFVRGGESKTFNFDALSKMNNGTIENHNFALEFTSHPMWYAVQALPYISEYKTASTEQKLNRYYANVLAAHIARSVPQIQSVFDQWSKYEPDALVSALEKNQDLKSALLKETPWVREAHAESDQKRNIGLLFDQNNLKSSLDITMQKLMKAQSSNGGFPWFAGGRDNWYMTQYVLEGLGHLLKLGAIDKTQMRALNQNVERAQNYLNRRLIEYYEKAQKNKKEAALNPLVLHYLYTKSLYTDWQSHTDNETIEKIYIEKVKTDWLKYSLYEQGMCALILHRNGDAQAMDILASFKERALSNPELGMYWKANNGYIWNQLPIERHALMIEVFTELEGHSNEVDELRLWLLKHKQTNHWSTTKSTAAAIYALLIRDKDSGLDAGLSDWAIETEAVDLTLGGETISFDSAEAGTGYIKVSKDKGEINTSLAEIKVENPNKNVAWGAAYYQYFEDLDKIDRDDTTPLKLKKDLFKVVTTDTGQELQPANNTELHPGDEIKVRVEIRVDRSMEYVHMKDMRSSGLEPMQVESRYKWENDLGYYESPEDLATHFYFSYLPKGTHVFEYSLRAVHRGTFSNGITTIQSMYAPEFNSHSKGETLIID